MPHKERGTKSYEVRQDAYIPRMKRELYWWFTQDLQEGYN